MCLLTGQKKENEIEVANEKNATNVVIRSLEFPGHSDQLNTLGSLRRQNNLSDDLKEEGNLPKMMNEQNNKVRQEQKGKNDHRNKLNIHNPRIINPDLECPSIKQGLKNYNFWLLIIMLSLGMCNFMILILVYIYYIY